MKDLTRAVRRKVIKSIRIVHHMRGDPLTLKWFFDENEGADDIWIAWVTFRNGLLPEQSSHIIFETFEEASAFESSHPVGSVLTGTVSSRDPDIPEETLEIYRAALDGKLIPSANNAGDEESPLAFDILEEAGITRGFPDRLSQPVLDFLGEERTDELKSLHQENWEIAAAFEYCLFMLPHSSPAYLAAAYQFCYYVRCDDFSAGYFWRDLEVIFHGVETEASKAINMRKNAGEKGRESSVRARNRRIYALMETLEGVAKRNPDIATALGPKSLLAIAVKEAVKTDPDLWSQGQGQVEEYLGEIRRGDAGKALKSRYQSLFSSKTA